MGLVLPIFILFFVSISASLLSEEKMNQNIKIISFSNNTEKNLTLKQLTRKIKNNQVIYIGESHDNANHHKIQLDMIKSLYNYNTKIAIGMEMFQSKFQDVVSDYIFGNISEQEFLDKTEYEKRWGYDYDLYKPIIDFAKSSQIPLIALNIESEIIKKISKNGISNLDAADLNKLPKHIDFTNEYYKNFLYEIFKDHPSKKDNSFEKFYSIQFVWDEFMAEKIDSFLKDYKEYQIVVLAGNGHIVYGYGIPSRTFKRNNKQYSVILNEVELKPQIADYIIDSQN
jgi:uncharacterized iron-regulated protein